MTRRSARRPCAPCAHARSLPRQSAPSARRSPLPRLVFLGSPEVSAYALEALVGAGHEVVLVVTAKDRRRGRGASLLPTPVKKAATSLGIPVTDRLVDVVSSGAELGIVVAFGRIVPASVFEVVPMVNLHFSLLPRWRGAAPVERAILAGDPTTGVCLMKLDKGLDTGPVYACEKVTIGEDETADELRSRLGEIGTAMLLRVLGQPNGLGTPRPQEGTPTYAKKLSKDELRLDFDKDAVELDRVVRAGRAWTTLRGRRLIVRRARARSDLGLANELHGALVGSFVATGKGALELVEVQSEGRGAMDFSSWATGQRTTPGEVLGQ